MVDQATPVGAHVFGTSALRAGVEPLGLIPDLDPVIDFVVDLTTESPRLQLDLRPSLTHDALLLVAPPWKVRVKRLIDILGSMLAMLVLAPVALAATVAVKLTSPGPALFGQRRAGMSGREFTLYKFRSMHVNAEAERDGFLDLNEVDGPIFKIKKDPRLTPVGRFIRGASIDELPQLWNVLRGDMSLVGPRPPIAREVEAYSAWESQRLVVKPGITCIWQVSGRSELDFETWVRMDIQYIEEWSLWFDLKLLARTIPAVLYGRGAY